MYKIEISSFWIDIIGKTVLYSVIAIVTFIIAIKLICVTIHDWHIKDEFSMNITIFILALVALSIAFNAVYLILNIWGILEISVV
jgi:hypothetical protein